MRVSRRFFNAVDSIHPKYILFSLLLSIFALNVWLTVENQMFGIDSWYWARVGGLQLYIVNIFSSVFILIVARFFFIGSYDWEQGTKTQWAKSACVLAIIFLSSTFTLRFLEVELDDYLFLMTEMLLIASFPRYAIHIGVASMMMFSAIHNFYGWSFFNTNSQFLENNIDYTKALNLVPVAYLLFVNKKWTWLLIMLGLFVLFPIPKFVGTALPMLIMGMLFTMRNKSLTYDNMFLIMLMLGGISTYFLTADFYVTHNQDAVSNLCDEGTKTCTNTDSSDWWYGHMMRYNGYQPTNYPSQNVSIF